MIEVTVAIVAMAGLFVLFGALRLADRRGCDGTCSGCTSACERHHDFEHHAEGGVR